MTSDESELERTLRPMSGTKKSGDASPPPAPAAGSDETTPPSGVDSQAGKTQFLAKPATREPLPSIPEVSIVREIGRGGMGVVYEGRQAYLDRRVAVKVLGQQSRGPEFEARFKREAKILASLTHPNIVGCYQAGVAPTGEAYLVMEFIDGPNLAQWISAHGALSPRAGLELCRDLALALGHAHRASIIHRDVKPANVLLRPRDNATNEFPFQAKLTDLGLARPVTTDATLMHLTVAGAVMGSPQTMAPEQFDDPETVDFRADIYGLGCVVYHALTGEPAFPQVTLTQTIASKLSDVSPDPRLARADLPDALAQFVRRMLARQREQRPQSYEAIVAECERLLETPAAPRAIVPAPRSRVRTVVALGFVAASIVVAWFELRPPASNDPASNSAHLDDAQRPITKSESESGDGERSNVASPAPSDSVPSKAAESNGEPPSTASSEIPVDPDLPTAERTDGAHPSVPENDDARADSDADAASETAEPRTGDEGVSSSTGEPTTHVAGSEPSGDRLATPLPPALARGEIRALFRDGAEDPLDARVWTYTPGDWRPIDGERFSLSTPRVLPTEPPARASYALPDGDWVFVGDMSLMRPDRFQGRACALRVEGERQALVFRLVHDATEVVAKVSIAEFDASAANWGAERSLEARGVQRWLASEWDRSQNPVRPALQLEIVNRADGVEVRWIKKGAAPEVGRAPWVLARSEFGRARTLVIESSDGRATCNDFRLSRRDD